MNPWLLSIPLAYLLGSIPFGYLLVKIFRKQDIRATGSGNIGATNVARSGAKGLGIATLLLDLGKAYLAVKIAQHLAPGNYDLAVVAAIAAILGHVFPIWLGFRGGKGVASALGSFLAPQPPHRREASSLLPSSCSSSSPPGTSPSPQSSLPHPSPSSDTSSSPSKPPSSSPASSSFRAHHHPQAPHENIPPSSLWHREPLRLPKGHRLSRITILGAGAWGTRTCALSLAPVAEATASASGRTPPALPSN